MNEIIKIIQSRYSCRNFTDDKPLIEDLKRILETSLYTPSGLNRQNWHITLLTNKDLIDQLDDEALKNIELASEETFKRIQNRGAKVFYNAQTMFILSINPMQDLEDSLIDLGILAQTITLSAESFGYQTLICGLSVFAFKGSKAEDFKELLNINPHNDIRLAILVGKSIVRKIPHTIDLSKISIIN